MSRVIPKEWLPASGRGKVHRVIVHWSAGARNPSLLDRSHYHFLIDGEGDAVKGARAPGLYLPHTRAMNTGSVGLSICAMAGASEGRRPYKYPVTHLQWERAAQAAAEICHAYGLTVSPRTVLTHSEVTTVYGVVQRGKWDVDHVGRPDEPEYGMSRDELRASFRRKVIWYLERVD